MFQYIAFLKGINVGGKNIVKMTDLTNLLTSHNYYNVKTYIQSGNIIFETNNPDMNHIKNEIKNLISTEYNISTSVILLTSNELDSILENNPFLKRKDFNSKYMYFTLSDDKLKNINISIDIEKFFPDEFIINNICTYVYTPRGYGKTKLTNTFFENKLKISATTRNLNTLNSINQAVNK
jgi:uncharacterized protein (DUF1697 family)